MAEKPILFNSEMVRAILDGRKTQTRRTAGLEDVNEHPEAWERVVLGDLAYMAKKRARGKYGATFQSKPGALEPRTISICPTICPYGRPGDLLWVRETFALDSMYDDRPPSQAECEHVKFLADGREHIDGYCVYEGDFEVDFGHNRPSIHMPRWASRITLQVTAVRVERLHEMSEFDMNAEGVASPGDDEGVHHITPFVKLWDSINEKRGCGWDANPWVWVVEFKVVQHA